MTVNSNTTKAATGIAGVVILCINGFNQVMNVVERRRNRKINNEMLENDRKRTEKAMEAYDRNIEAAAQQQNYFQALYAREMGES